MSNLFVSTPAAAAPSVVVKHGGNQFDNAYLDVWQTDGGKEAVASCDTEYKIALDQLSLLIKGGPKLNLVVEMLQEAALAVASYWETHFYGHHLVVLGRDGWPLVPLLQDLGLPCSYFIFSRLQIGDEGTAAQWLKEIAPDALVVDTGYQGSIFEAIKVFDPTISGLLLSSSGEYPQVDLPYNHSEVVKEVEKLPKVVGRGVAINAKGHVRCPQDTRDDDENLAGLSPAEVVKLNRKLCMLLGIDLSWASFTGITPESRIPWELDWWYQEVAEQRANLDPLCYIKVVESMCLSVDDDPDCPSTFVKANSLEHGFMKAVENPFVYKEHKRRPKHYKEDPCNDAGWYVVDDQPEGGYAVAVKIPYVKEWRGCSALVVRVDYVEGFASAKSIIPPSQQGWEAF